MTENQTVSDVNEKVLKLLTEKTELLKSIALSLAQANNISNQILNYIADTNKDVKSHMFDYKRVNGMIKPKVPVQAVLPTTPVNTIDLRK